MQIRRTSGVQSANAIKLQTQNNLKSVDTQTTAPVDQLELSSEAQLISQTNSTTNIRMDRVNDIRAQIASGTYETPEKTGIGHGANAR